MALNSAAVTFRPVGYAFGMTRAVTFNPVAVVVRRISPTRTARGHRPLRCGNEKGGMLRCWVSPNHPATVIPPANVHAVPVPTAVESGSISPEPPVPNRGVCDG